MSDELHKEIREIKQQAEENANDSMTPVLDAYKRALDRTRSELMQLAEDYTEDGKLSVSRTNRYQILQRMQKLLSEQMAELGATDVKTVEDILSDTYESAYYQTGYQLDRGLEIAGDFAIVTPEIVQAAVYTPIEGEMFSDRIWNNKDKLVRRIRDVVEKSLINGDDPAKLARQVKKEFDVSAYESMRLVQTEVSRVAENANERMYRESNVIEQELYDATLDNKTSEFCESHDGEIYDLDDPDKPKLPAHPNCRSTYVPVVDGWSPSKKIDNETKKQIDYTSVKTWRESRGLVNEE